MEASPAVDEYITVFPDTADDIDYLAIARHNFGSGQMAVSVEGLADPGPPENWTELVGETLLPNDSPTIFRFTPQPLHAIRLRIQPSQAAAPAVASLAVLYVGLLLVLVGDGLQGIRHMAGIIVVSDDDRNQRLMPFCSIKPPLA